MSSRSIANIRSVTGIPTARLVTWWVIASEIFIFGGLLASYVMHRLAHPEWAIAAAHTNTEAGATSIRSCCSPRACSRCWRTRLPTPTTDPRPRNFCGSPRWAAWCSLRQRV